MILTYLDALGYFLQLDRTSYNSKEMISPGYRFWVARKESPACTIRREVEGEPTLPALAVSGQIASCCVNADAGWKYKVIKAIEIAMRTKSIHIKPDDDDIDGMIIAMTIMMVQVENTVTTAIEIASMNKNENVNDGDDTDDYDVMMRQFEEYSHHGDRNRLDG